MKLTVSLQNSPLTAKKQTLDNVCRVYILPTEQTSSALIQIENKNNSSLSYSA